MLVNKCLKFFRLLFIQLLMVVYGNTLHYLLGTAVFIKVNIQRRFELLNLISELKGEEAIT